MPEVFYKAKDFRNKIKRGTIEAADVKQARNILKSMKLKPIMIKVQKDSWWSKYFILDEYGRTQIQFSHLVPTTKELAIFTKQFALMLERGITLVNTLELLASQEKNLAFKKVIRKIKKRVESGFALSEALRDYPNIFDSLYVSMVQAGEASGSLDKTLKQIMFYLERNAKIRSQIKSAMTYPTIVILVTIVIVYGVLAFLVPTFAKMYSDMGQKLPCLTQKIILISNIITGNINIITISLVNLFIGFNIWKRTPKGKEQFDWLLLKFPLTGDLIKKIAISRFTSTMSTMLSSGVQILEALNICAAAAGNVVIEKIIRELRNKVSKGEYLSKPMREYDIFPMMVTSMIEIGEETGALDETMQKISEIYEEEVEIAIKAMIGMIQPIVIVVIGGVIGVTLIALYLPIFSLASVVG